MVENEYQETDVVLINDFPFMTFTESKIPNTWYHDKYDWLCILTSRGFRPTKGSKAILFKNGFGR